MPSMNQNVAGFNVDWKGKELQKAIRNGLAKNVAAAGQFFKAQVTAALSTSGRKVTITATKSGRTRKTLGAKGSNRSKAGDPPHKQTGELRRSVFKKVKKNKVEVRVGTRAPYGGVLEFGGANIAPRPYLRSTLQRNKSQIAAMIGRRII